jgi:Ti-type conjugative transfer relaxase TraA
MANYHLTVKMISRQGGKSCVASLAYRSATKLEDQRTGEMWDYTKKSCVGHVEILTPEDAPAWINDIAKECKTSRQSALQKFSDICEAAEIRKDSQVYREVEFSLPNELANEQNIAWANEFMRDVFVKRGMVAVVNFHFDIDPNTGMEKPHCHAALTTRDLAEDGFGLKNRDWNCAELIFEAREQCAQYQNSALKEHGFETQVSHLSYIDRELDVDPQPKLSQNIREMTVRGIETDKRQIFDMVRLKNQFKIVKNPEIVFSIVTSNHSTFTRKDIAKVLHRYIDDPQQFQNLYHRLVSSKELVNLESLRAHKDISEPVYTTQEMLCIEMNLVRTSEVLSAQKTHGVSPQIVEKVIAKYHQKFKQHGGLSADQENAIRHMLSSPQISCVVGFAGAGKTTCLEAVREAWEEAGYRVIGLAPTGKAARNIEDCGIRSMTIHKFLLAQKDGRERISAKTIIVGDEFGMVDSRRCSELLSLIDKSGAKIVPMGDGNQAQAVEAGPAFRLLTTRVKPAVLETIVRQQIEWQREATRLFGTLQTGNALSSYLENGCFRTIQEKTPDQSNNSSLLDQFCLARQMSGRIWKEMKGDSETLGKHRDFKLYQEWKNTRQTTAKLIIDDYAAQQDHLKERGVDVKVLSSLVEAYKTSPETQLATFQKIEPILRQMSYEHIADTRSNTRQAMVDAWGQDYQAAPQESHLMLAFTNKDANKLNIAAQLHMREQGVIQGKDFEFVTQRIETDDFGVEQRTSQNRTFAQGDRLLFTRNDNGLKVKNGSLGTILSIDQRNFKVQLDKVGDKEGEIVSFAPNLYPFIDNGWATTIIKAQGVTVDNVKLLASFEQYRNLAYVGMSRHRHSLNIFASSLDFWREEKIIDRLSRVQEKLSGFDYLDTDKIQEKLEEDTHILWHAQKIQQGKDFWTAVKVTAQDVFDKALGRPQEGKGDEKFISFENSEEMRSKDFFEDASKQQTKESQIKLREEFEETQLPFHQEWCANLGFFREHKRFPENEAEISAAYWQGERLTAIEGRLYEEALKAGETKIDEDKLTLQARAELAKNQAAPAPIMAFGKASDLTEAQLKQFEQHVLIHQDKAGQPPKSSDLNAICQAIKVHDQVIKGEGFDKTLPPNLYRTLIEQQVLLTNDKEREAIREEKIMMKEGISAQPLKRQGLQGFCVDRLQRMNDKIQEIKAFIQEMKTLEMSRQNQRGMEM